MTRQQSTEPATLRRVRCAVYARKSTEEGLDSEFNSLDAQRESGEAYVASQKQEGWASLPARYDDGGYSGATLDRPAMQRLLADIDGGKVDCVVCYKIDRLSRSLLDFAKLMEVFDRHDVSFVSVTQRFDTSTSMGRLLLNILLSFAQFEREIIGERIRDKVAATLSRMRSPMISRSNWAKERRMLSINRPMGVLVSKRWVTETKETFSRSKISMSLTKSSNERENRSSL
jgi:site-specific DNA recombinase